MPFAPDAAGPSHAAQAAPARPAGPAARPQAGADGAPAPEPADEPADTVAISADALARQRQGALAVAVQRLGLLLEALVRANGPTGPGDLSTLAELAGDVGATAQDIGAAFAGATLPPGAARAAARAGASAEPMPAAGSPVRSRAGAPSPAGGGRERGGVLDRPSAMPPDTDRGGHGPAPATSPAGVASGDPAREVRAAGALLDAAAEALATAKLGLQATSVLGTGDGGPAPARTAGMADHVTRCEAQVSLAMAQVAGCPRRVGGTDPARPGRSAATAMRSGGDPVRQLLLARAAFAAVLLCAAAAAVWAAAALDSMPARAMCAAALGVLCAARGWRGVARRLPRGASVAIEPRGMR